MLGTTNVITGKKTLFSYAHLLEPKSFNDGQPKYSVSLVIPKSDKATIEEIKSAIKAAYEEGKYVIDIKKETSNPLEL